VAQVLVIEDEKVVALDLKNSLTKMGHQVLRMVDTGEDGIKSAAAQCPDVALVDIRIKGNIDGIQTAKVLREKFDVPIIYLTAYADAETIARAKCTTPSGYLIKPFRIEELKSALEIALYRQDIDLKQKQREKWLTTSLKSVKDAVITVNRDGEITYINPSAESLTGYVQADVIGKKLVDVMPLVNTQTREKVQTPTVRVLKESKEVTLPPHTSLIGNKSEQVIENTASIVDEAGELAGAVIVFRNGTETDEMQQQVALTDRLNSLGTLVSGVAHEVNNPLGVIVANAAFIVEELEERKEDFPDMLDAVKDIQEASERIRKIVSDLKMYSRPSSESITQVDVQETLNWAIRLTSSEIRHRANLIRDFNEIPKVDINEHRLGQVFVNLIINACHAIPEGSTDKNEIKISTYADAEDMVVIEVSDTGCGIKPEILNRIFDPFFTTKPVGVGTGLGLSITHGIVTSAKGKITVDSTLGKGTMFRVRLPRSNELSLTQPTIVESAMPSLRRSKILVVDDEPMLLKLIHRTLSPEHDVLPMQSSVQALQFLKKHPEIDLILCDVMMPEMSGMELYECAMDECPEMISKFVFMTAGTFSDKADEFLSSIANQHLEKPFQPDQLRTYIREIVAQSATG
jgi:PAS domain S-box-containing protein